MEKRFIFDLDGTLMHGNFSKEDDYFRSVLSTEEFDRFSQIKYQSLLEYEEIFPKYDVDLLSKFLSERANVNITADMIREWIVINSYLDDILVDGVVDVLDYLKSKDKSLVVLTNWFTSGQVCRLRSKGLLKYFDEVHGGDFSLKPNYESYRLAAGIYDMSSCVMIGDTLEKDVIGPRRYGMKSIYYNENAKSNEFGEIGIKQMKKIKEMY